MRLFLTDRFPRRFYEAGNSSRLAVMHANNDFLGVRSAYRFWGTDAEGRPYGAPVCQTGFLHSAAS